MSHPAAYPVSFDLHGGQDFWSFQWDILLLEAGFLAIFLDESHGRQWLFRWLLFRLMFMSGLVKLLSGDAAWRNLTALGYHYETQPLPTPLAWYMFQLPGWFQKASTAVVFLTELLVPLLIFAPARLRQIAAYLLIGLQVLILLTGLRGVAGVSGVKKGATTTTAVSSRITPVYRWSG